MGNQYKSPIVMLLLVVVERCSLADFHYWQNVKSDRLRREISYAGFQGFQAQQQASVRGGKGKVERVLLCQRVMMIIVFALFVHLYPVLPLFLLEPEENKYPGSRGRERHRGEC